MRPFAPSRVSMDRASDRARTATLRKGMQRKSREVAESMKSPRAEHRLGVCHAAMPSQMLAVTDKALKAPWKLYFSAEIQKVGVCDNIRRWGCLSKGNKAAEGGQLSSEQSHCALTCSTGDGSTRSKEIVSVSST